MMTDLNLAKLDEIDHIVVLMLENRSFDHMLGYLSLPESMGGKGRDEIDGLKASDEYRNIYKDKVYTPQPLDDDFLIFPWDPAHSYQDTQIQLEDNNGGFVRNFMESKKAHTLVKGAEKNDPGKVMGYHTGAQLRAFDHLAEQFCVCDRWFCSLAGPTVPNRLYAMAGTSDGETANPGKTIPFRSYDLKTIFEFLSNVSVKHYAADVASLLFFKQHRKVKTMIKPLTDNMQSFFLDAKKGRLPSVAWIDPNFGILSRSGNDDHPPKNVQKGQALVSQVYNALLRSPNWEKTLFVVTYDEHGGFYDHVVPPTVEDRYPHMRKSLGVRIPTIVVSPWIGKRSVSHEVFDHTSTLKTILLRFARDNNGEIPFMSERVQAATPLSSLLTKDAPRRDCTAAPQITPSRHDPVESEVTDLEEMMKMLYEDAMAE